MTRREKGIRAASRGSAGNHERVGTGGFQPTGADQNHVERILAACGNRKEKRTNSKLRRKQNLSARTSLTSDGLAEKKNESCSSGKELPEGERLGP